MNQTESRARVLDHAGRLLVALDYDGTLAPIVDDPDAATIHPGAPAVLVDLAAQGVVIAVITGRPVRQVLGLGRLDQVGELVVLGQYGNERWDTRARRIVSPAPPAGLAGLIGDLPRLLRRAGVPDAWVEEKGLAVAVHTRRCADPRAAYDRVLPLLTDAAAARGLAVEPGRLVVEVRAPGMDKGGALRELVGEYAATAVVFVGDDLGDLAAFRAVRDLDAEGVPGLTVCSGSVERPELAALADVVVDGPDGVVAWLADLARDLADP